MLLDPPELRLGEEALAGLPPAQVVRAQPRLAGPEGLLGLARHLFVFVDCCLFYVSCSLFDCICVMRLICCCRLLVSLLYVVCCLLFILLGLAGLRLGDLQAVLFRPLLRGGRITTIKVKLVIIVCYSLVYYVIV